MIETAAAVEVRDTQQEIAALVRQLHDTQRRLQQLAGGELDAVLHPDGQYFLLHDAQERLRKSESAQRELAATQSSILNALPAHVALLDHAGVILSVNDGWRDFALLHRREDAGFRAGSNYLAACESAWGVNSDQAKVEAAGIRTVLDGKAATFSLEYPYHGATAKYWFRLMVNGVPQDGLTGAVVMHIDITERKLGEENLAASEALLRHFIEHTPAAIAILDKQMRYIQTSARWMQDYHLTGQDVVGRRHYDVFPNFPQRWKDVNERVLAGAIERCDEDAFLRADGSPEWLQWELRPWRNADGEIGGIIIFTHFITEQKRAQESLILFRTLIDQAGDAFEVLDPQTLRFLDCNESACTRLGYTRQEFLELSVPDIVHELEPEMWERAAEVLRVEGSMTFEARHKRKDGSHFPVEVSLKRVKLARNYLVAAVRDITERRRTEARFSRLVSSNVQGVIFWNASGELTVANDAFLRMVGHSRADFEAGRVNWLQMTPPEYAHLDRNALKEIAATGVSAAYEKELFRADGSRVSVLLGAAAFEDNPNEGVCFFIDLTERKELELHFLRAQRMESIGTLAGGIAHDLNNTLSPIIMSLDILAKRFTDPDSAHLLDILSASAHRGANMVRQVLTFARGVEGERREMQVGHLVHEIDNIVRDTFPKNIRLSLAVPTELWTILGDATQLHQVLLNFCVNARDALPAGGKIFVSAENLILDEHYAAMNPPAHAGNYICLQVQDNGTGIAAKDLVKIFDHDQVHGQRHGPGPFHFGRYYQEPRRLYSRPK